MASHNGIILFDAFDSFPEGVQVHNIPDQGNIDPVNNGTGEHRDYYFGTSAISLGSPVQRKAQLDGVALENFGDDLIYHRIWVEPLSIDAAFITEESTHNVYIWNAKFDNANITNVDSILPDGTSFSLTPASIPVNMGFNVELIYVVTVESLGPPIQDTYYEVTVDGLDYLIYIQGTRVIPVNQEPNWGTIPQYRFMFQTVLFQSPTYKEQRRSLTNKMLREALLEFVIQNNLLVRFTNEINYGHDKVFGVPIVSEISILSTAANNGDTTLLLDGITDNFWNLNNVTTHILIINYELDVSEIKEIDTINSTNIVLARGLIEDYPVGTVVYPCFFATIKAVKFRSATNTTETISIEFKEFILGSLV